jgi:hypothetical protein
LTKQPSAGWFREKIIAYYNDDTFYVDKLLEDYSKGTLSEIDQNQIANKLSKDMATVFCDNLSIIAKTNKKDEIQEFETKRKNCITKRQRVYLEGYDKRFKSSIFNDIKAIETDLQSNAGGAKRTRKRKLNKNHRKTKRINKFNRKRKTRRLNKNKRRITKKR